MKIAVGDSASEGTVVCLMEVPGAGRPAAPAEDPSASTPVPATTPAGSTRAGEAAAGLPSHFDARVIPSVAYTDLEIAWVGVTEADAKAQGLKFGKGVFPWAASGRSLSLGRDEGMTKLIFDEETQRLIGAGIDGSNADDFIAEAAHAIEMGSNAADIVLTVHPHPTLSETVAMAAEAFESTITDLYMPKAKR